MSTSYGPLSVWGVVVVVGLLTFGIRVSFVYLFGRIDDIPPWVAHALRFVPAAVFAALVAPSLVVPADGGAWPVPVPVQSPPLLAGVVAAVVAWRTENVLATIAAGMVALWTIGYLW